MSRPTTDATVSSIAYEGEFITSEMRLEVYDEGETLLHSRDIKILPGLLLRDKHLLHTIINPSDGTEMAFVFLTYRIYDNNSDELIGELAFEFNPIITDESGKQPYELVIDILSFEGQLSGALTIKYCVHPSTDLGKISDVINNADCICRYLNDIKIGTDTKQLIYDKIDELYNYLWFLGLLDRPAYQVTTTTQSLSPEPISIGERYCNKLQQISYWLNLIKNIPSGLTDIELLNLKNYVYDLHIIFSQNITPQYCDSTGFLWPEKRATHIVQSPDLYVQASGSNANDGVTEGVLLRWSLNGDLGSNHIPKGGYGYNELIDGNTNPYKTSAGYSNNDNDFVKIYRVKYDNPRYFDLNFDQQLSGIKITQLNTNKDEFEFSLNNRIVVFELSRNNYLSNASNILTYQSSTDTYDCSSLRDFIDVYDEVFSIAVYEQDTNGFRGDVLKAFSVSFILTPDVNAIATDEVLLTAFEGADPNVRYNLKQPVLKQDSSNKTFFTESIQKVQVKTILAKVEHIKFEFYDDFLYNPRRNWTYLGQYALSLDDTLVEKRLKGESDAYAIDDNWPKYNDDVKVKVGNYIDKWSDSTEGFKLQVENYLDLSKDSDNLKAIGTTEPVVSFLNLLKLQSIDFHVARMLGLATIDLDGAGTGDSYVYMAYYKAPSAQGIDINIGFLEHIYLTLPTNTDDFRLPFVPSLASFTHNGQSLSTEVIDENGYSYFEANRLVNVNRNMLPYEVAHSLTPEDLLSISGNYFNLGGEKTKPFSLGIEYGLLNLNPDKELPNVAHDKVYPAGTEYKDFKGGSEIDETILVLDNSNPLYTHLELEEGIHKYALYGVNWFSRASSVSAEDALETTFVNKNIKPPVNLQAHYIQREDPAVFTSIAEQNELEQRLNANPEIPEPNLTRVTFDWNGYQNGNYQYAKEVHFYFRSDLPEIVKGKISSVTQVSGTGNYLVTTDKIKLTSTDGSYMEPIVAYPQKMVGSELKTQSGTFKIISCSADVQGYLQCVIKPSDTNKLIEDSNLITNRIEYRTKKQNVLPKVDEYFSVRANTTLSEDWHKLNNQSNKVTITNFVDANSNPHTEEFIDSDNNVLTQVVGGIFKDTGSVTKLDDEVTGMDDLYEITLSHNLSIVPPGNNRNNVNYHEGSVRLKTTSGKIRELRVFSISGFGTSSLTLLAHDVNADASDPIKTSGINFINFHPGYRIYLSSEGDFYSGNIEPGLGSDLKKTWLAAKSYDFDNDYYVADPFLAPFSTPVTLLATREKQPLAPGNFVVNTKFATRPDSFGKASYSIDVPLGAEKPFATAFYRTTDRAILSALYDADTLADVLENLKNIEVNNAEDKRFEELVAGVLNNDSDAFKEYNGYALPLPTLYEGESQGTAIEIVQRVKNRIESTLLPVTPEPCIYSFIKTRNSGLTSNKKPVLTDDSGNLLLVNDASFDPYPFMSKVSVSGERLRYTDYTLSGNSNARYFYAFKHQADNLKMSAWSGIVGPVNLINASMFEAPIIEKYEILLANKVLETKPSVKFSIQPFPEIIGVKNVRLYRTFSSASAKNLLSMDVVGDFDLTQDEVIDSFNSIAMPPTEEDIFYRLVGLREVRVEQRLDEQNLNSEFKTEIYFSEATDVIVVQLPDNINPNSPDLKCICTGNSANQLLNVAIEFDSVMYKGNYYLHKLNNNGAWDLIDQIENNGNMIDLSFAVGDLLFTDGTSKISHVFKVVARNKSGLFSLDDNQVNPVHEFVPSPSIVGARITCINQATLFKAVKSNPDNIIEWRKDNGVVGTTDSVNIVWTTIGLFQVDLKESNSSSGLSYTQSIQVQVKQVPAPAINGPVNACTNTELNYETQEVIGNYYNWVVQGGTIISGQGTNLIGVVWSEAGTGVVKVQESNGGCVVESSSMGVSILTKPNPVLVAESSTICTNQQLQIEIIGFDSANSYTWEHNGQMVALAGGVASITWNTDGVKNVRVLATNGTCTVESNIVTIDVLAKPNPILVVGSYTVCTGQQLEFEIINFDHATSYTWEHNGQMMSQSEGIAWIMWDTEGMKNVRVVATNGICTVESNFIIIDVLATPLAGVIMGPVNPPSGIAIQYQKSDYYSGNNVEWTVSENGAIISGQGTDTIEVIWQLNGTVEWIEAIESNISCDSTSTRLDVFPQ